MYVVIAGGGATGLILATRLEKKNVDVTIIERDVERCDELLIRTRAHVIRGDATDPEVLEEAEIERADYLVCITGDDKTNILIALIGRHIGIENIIVRVEHPTYEKIAREMGFKNVINPAETGATMIEAVIRGIRVIEMFRIEDESVDMEEIVVDRSSRFRDKPLKYLSEVSKDSVYPIMIIHNGEIIIPDPNYKLKEGDRIWILRKRRRFLF